MNVHCALQGGLGASRVYDVQNAMNRFVSTCSEYRRTQPRHNFVWSKSDLIFKSATVLEGSFGRIGGAPGLPAVLYRWIVSVARRVKGPVFLYQGQS
jgi:hypothetical protein